MQGLLNYRFFLNQKDPQCDIFQSIDAYLPILEKHRKGNEAFRMNQTCRRQFQPKTQSINIFLDLALFTMLRRGYHKRFSQKQSLTLKNRPTFDLHR